MSEYLVLVCTSCILAIFTWLWLKLVPVKKCVNCYHYNWKQPDDPYSLHRCPICNILLYCSKECQKEHWEKVHKYHCKYLSGRSVQSDISHEPSVCRYCLKEAKVGERKMRSTNHHLGCPWNMSNVVGNINDVCVRVGELSFPSPFQLGEITGNYECKVEHTVVIVQRLLCKLYTVYEAPHSDCAIKKLIYMRCLLRSYYVFVPAKALEKNTILCCKIPKFDAVKSEVFIDIQKVGSYMIDINAEDTLKIIDIALFLFQFIGHIGVDDAVPVCLEDQFAISADRLMEMWGQCLALLETDKWTYQKLIDIVCTGVTKLKCFGCCREVIKPRHILWLKDKIRSYDTYLKNVYGMSLGPSVIVCTPYPRLAFICGADACITKFDKPGKSIDFDPIMCDNCFKVARSCLRCSRCLTKLYCSKACQREDWSVHKKICVINARKMK